MNRSPPSACGKPAPDMHLRTATSADIPRLLVMMRDLYEHDAVPFNPVASQAGIQYWLNSLESGISPLGHIYVIEVAGEPAGYLVLAFNFSLEFGGSCTFIDEFYISESHRSQGNGAHILKQVMDLTAKRGGGAVLLEASDNNDRAMRLYLRSGFSTHPRRLMSVKTS